MEYANKYSADYRIHYYETDYRKNVLPTALINYFQDIAITHSEDVGLDFDYLARNHFVWMVYQWEITIHDYQQYRDKLRITTWVSAVERFNAYRHFAIVNQQGEKVVTASSRWVLIDTDKMKPTRIPAEMKTSYAVPDAECIESMSKLARVDHVEHERTFTVRYSDIDTNKHVNNVKYVEWAIETIPLEIVLDYTLHRIKVTYKKQAKFGDTVTVQTQLLQQEAQISAKHQIVNQDGQVVCLAETIWRA